MSAAIPLSLPLAMELAESNKILGVTTERWAVVNASRQELFRGSKELAQLVVTGVNQHAVLLANTPAVQEVLSLMVFETGPLCDLLRSAGEVIPQKAEAEQAYILHRLLPFAMAHGWQWRIEHGKFLKQQLETFKNREVHP